jgi:hypothetical protein
MITPLGNNERYQSHSMIASPYASPMTKGHGKKPVPWDNDMHLTPRIDAQKKKFINAGIISSYLEQEQAAKAALLEHDIT